MVATGSTDHPVRLPRVTRAIGFAETAFDLGRRRFLLSTCLLFLALATLNYWPVLFGMVPLPTELILQFPPWETCCAFLRTKAPQPNIGDLVTQHYVWRAFLGDALRRGELPLWNPYSLLGTPFIGNAQSSLFYPLNVLYALLPTATAWSLGFILRSALVGLFTTLFARSIGASRDGSVVAGIIVSFCASTMVWQAQPIGDAMLWLSLAFWAVQRLLIKPGPISVITLSAVFCLSLLAGYPQGTVHIGLATALYATYLSIASSAHGCRLRERLGFVALFAAAGILALGLAAVQLLPMAEWISETSRSLDTRYGHRPITELVGYLSRDHTRNPNAFGTSLPDASTYVGLLTLVLVPCAFLGRRKGTALFFTGLTLIWMEVIFGLAPFYWVFDSIPIIAGAKNYRLVGVASFGIAMLAALGLTAIEERLSRTRTGRGTSGGLWVFVAGAVALAAMSGLRVFWFAFERPVNLALSGPLSSAAFLFFGAAVILWGLTARPERRVFTAIVVVVICADVLGAGFGYIPFVKTETVYPEPASFSYLRAHTGDRYRILVIDVTVAENIPAFYGLYSAGGYDNPLRRTALLEQPLSHVRGRLTPTSLGVAGLEDRRLDLMNIKYLVANKWSAGLAWLEAHPERYRLVHTDGPVRIYENTAVLPRAFLVPLDGAEILRSDEAQLARLSQSSFDPAKAVLLSDWPRVSLSRSAAGESERPSNVTAFEQSANGVRAEAWVAEPSILVLSQAYYPGWRVSVNGEPRELLRADYGFTGVLLESGWQTVHFSYEPDSLRFGVYVSLLSLAILTGLATIAGWRAHLRSRMGK